MSEFKFACPMCGQHIKCDSERSGKQVDCPTCFQKLVVPEAPQGDVSKLVLNAALANGRRYKQSDTTRQVSVVTNSSRSKFPVLTVVVLVCAVGVAFAFRQTLLKETPEVVQAKASTDTPTASNTVLANDANWTLDLTSATIPDRPIAGRINGRIFNPARITFRSDTLNFKQGEERPPDLGLMIVFFVKDGRELAGKTMSVSANDSSAPKVLLRWKDESGKSVSQYYTQGYALRLEFNPLYGSHLTGKVYFCAPDAAKSYVSGTFDAEILPPSPAKANEPRKQKLAHSARR